MKIIKILGVVIVLLVLVNVTLTNRSVDDSQKVADLSSQIASLGRDNTILRSQVAEAGSLTLLSDKIAAAGFADASKIASLPVRSTVAMAR